MRQIENRTNGAISGFNGQLGRAKMKAANRIHQGEAKARKRDAEASRNAYRIAIGLPPISTPQK